MEAYPKTARVNNIGVAPALPVYRRTFEERRALSMQQCERPVSEETMERRRAALRARGSAREPSLHPGRARRHRWETQTKQSLAWLAGLQTGAPSGSRGPSRAYSLRELLDGGGPERPQWVRAAQLELARRLTLAERHGPASGWGIAQPEAGAKGNPKWTPYYVPKAAEKCWRWWRRLTLAAGELAATLARWLLQAVPLHRHRLEQETAEKKQSSSPQVPQQETTGYRDHSGDGWEAALERARAASGT